MPRPCLNPGAPRLAGLRPRTTLMFGYVRYRGNPAEHLKIRLTPAADVPRA